LFHILIILITPSLSILISEETKKTRLEFNEPQHLKNKENFEPFTFHFSHCKSKGKHEYIETWKWQNEYRRLAMPPACSWFARYVIAFMFT